MPKRSSRDVFLEDIELKLMMMVLDDEDESEEFWELVEIADMTEKYRYLIPREPIPKTQAIRDLLYEFPDSQFRQICRCDKRTFVSILNMISQHPIFHSASRKRQTPTHIQLMIALNRFGCNGNGSSIGAISRFGGMSYGTVCLCTERVITAILSFRDGIISWPGEEERNRISRRHELRFGLKGAVGILDGTPIVLSQRPHIDGEVFFNRKCTYCMNVQLICDDTKLIRAYQLGWPGSVYDNTVWSRSHMFRNPQLYFSPNEYLLADNGYALNEFTCTPYKQPAANVEVNRAFNMTFARARVIIEHVNGLLKNRFSSLRNLRIQVKKRKDFDSINRWIMSCLILHNICTRMSDFWDDTVHEEEGFDPQEQVEAPAQGNSLRERVHQNLIRYFNGG